MIGLCHICFTSGVELELNKKSVPICKECSETAGV